MHDHMQLESYVLNRDNKVNIALTGYCRLYNLDHTADLDHDVEGIVVAQQVFLTTAIFFLCLIIAIRVPVALYVVPVNSGQSPTAPSRSGDNSTATNQVDSRGLEASTVVDNLGKQMLNKIRESNYIHYFLAIFAIAPFLNIGIILLNVCMLNMYELTWQIVGFSTAIIVFSGYRSDLNSSFGTP